jgi:hypothetical protein
MLRIFLGSDGYRKLISHTNILKLENLGKFYLKPNLTSNLKYKN